MSVPERMSGVLTPVVTPFGNDLAPDAKRLTEQCRWLLAQEVGLAVFGTNSEANSMSVDEKIELIDRLLEAGIDAARMMPGTGCAAFTDSVRLTSHAVNSGCSGVLMLPPFYYKDVSDDGLFAVYAEIIERIGDARLRIYLYHIPPISQVPLSLPLIERLITSYPETVVGIKDSGGDWANTKAMLDAGWDDFRIFVGSEAFLLDNMRNGGDGCISASANVNPAAILALYHKWDDGDGEAMQAGLNDVRERFIQFPMIAALKAGVAHFSGDPGWAQMRPPLVALDAGQQAQLQKSLEDIGFTMDGLGAGK
ncbi:MAG: dihydrodipicolinate synthase family protein [Rhodospirillales bacterium]|nr:dihydrodipicolinate synthase family protein [Rhodospirillales bacterium]